ncbi:MAG: KRRI-Interacting protein 1 [Caeruleum heppii]|nr:MAG: KRRI-Interacting protein 1 [Caeruleum heppii]
MFAIFTESRARPAKKQKLMLDDDGSSSGTNGLDDHASVSRDSVNGTTGSAFQINEDYARRFEHNKKREEKHRLEEKYKDTALTTRRGISHGGSSRGGGAQSDPDTSSTSEEEDDEGVLATEALDAEISATLQAIRSKDPRVYDTKSAFYCTIQEEGQDEAIENHKPKPMFLKDYHRRNLLEGYTGGENEVPPPTTYQQEQSDLQRDVINQMHAAPELENSGVDSIANAEMSESDDGGFLIPKAKPLKQDSVAPNIKQSKQALPIDPTEAENDPDSFLSNFLTARAWVPTTKSQLQPFESDDEEEDQRAEVFEAAYNLRFEDPGSVNKNLMSHARDVVAKHTVRREDLTGRKKARETQREQRDAEKRQREEERARLRKLRIDEVEEKVKKVKEAAGLRNQTLKEEDWAKFFDDGWDDERWEEEMKKRFGETYYAEKEAAEEADDLDERHGAKRKKNKVQKPKWNDDIDITDIVPESVEDGAGKAPFDVSDDEEHENHEAAEGPSAISRMTNKDRVRERSDRKRVARLERRRIETMVDDAMDLDISRSTVTSKQPTRFRYRDTSPTTYGLTARDILLASDSQLNAYAGLKKLAAFRDTEKKRRDKKRLGKKARLREWRRETFGDEQGPKDEMVAEVLGGKEERDVGKGKEKGEEGVNMDREGGRKRKRSKKH